MCKILERVICYNEWIGLNWIGLGKDCWLRLTLCYYLDV